MRDGGFAGRWVVLVLAVLFSAAAGGWLGWRSHAANSAFTPDDIVAVSWGDGKYGPGFYGAYVYLVPGQASLSVRGRVYIGRGNDYFHDLGEFGRVQTAAEAVTTWGTIRWEPDGLYIGSGDRAFFMPRAKIESHR